MLWKQRLIDWKKYFIIFISHLVQWNPINFRLTPFRILYHFFFKGIAKQLKLHEVFEIQSKIIQLVILIECYMIFSYILWNICYFDLTNVYRKRLMCDGVIKFSIEKKKKKKMRIKIRQKRRVWKNEWVYLTVYQTGVVFLNVSKVHSPPLIGGGGGKGSSRSKVTNSCCTLGLYSSSSSWRTSAVVLTCEINFFPS